MKKGIMYEVQKPVEKVISMRGKEDVPKKKKKTWKKRDGKKKYN